MVGEGGVTDDWVGGHCSLDVGGGAALAAAGGHCCFGALAVSVEEAAVLDGGHCGLAAGATFVVVDDTPPDGGHCAFCENGVAFTGCNAAWSSSSSSSSVDVLGGHVDLLPGKKPTFSTTGGGGAVNVEVVVEAPGGTTAEMVTWLSSDAASNAMPPLRKS